MVTQHSPNKCCAAMSQVGSLSLAQFRAIEYVTVEVSTVSTKDQLFWELMKEVNILKHYNTRFFCLMYREDKVSET